MLSAGETSNCFIISVLRPTFRLPGGSRIIQCGKSPFPLWHSKILSSCIVSLQYLLYIWHIYIQSVRRNLHCPLRSINILRCNRFESSYRIALRRRAATPSSHAPFFWQHVQWDPYSALVSPQPTAQNLAMLFLNG